MLTEPRCARSAERAGRDHGEHGHGRRDPRGRQRRRCAAAHRHCRLRRRMEPHTDRCGSQANQRRNQCRGGDEGRCGGERVASDHLRYRCSQKYRVRGRRDHRRRVYGSSDCQEHRAAARRARALGIRHRAERHGPRTAACQVLRGGRAGRSNCQADGRGLRCDGGRVFAGHPLLGSGPV